VLLFYEGSPPPQVFGILLASGVVALAGLLDDRYGLRRGLSWRHRYWVLLFWPILG
jgi:hypothetical protein